MNLNSKHHIWREPGTAHHWQSTSQKSSVLVSAHAVAGTEGLVRVEEKLNAPKYWDWENPVQSIQDLRRTEESTSNRTVT